MAAGTASYTTGCCGAGVFPSRVQEGAPSAGSSRRALIVVVVKAMTVGRLGQSVETESPFGPKFSCKGPQSLADKLGCFGASYRNSNRRSSLPDPGCLSGEPPGLRRECKTRVEGGEFRCNCRQGISGTNAMHQ